MTENFAECFVDHGHIGLASQTVSKLPLHHAERGFNVAPLVVVGKEILLAEHEVMKHLLVGSPNSASSIPSERNERCSAELVPGAPLLAAFARSGEVDFLRPDGWPTQARCSAPNS